MKKIFTLSVAALVAFTTNAQFNFMTEVARQEFPTKVEAIRAPQNMQNKLRRAKAVVKDEAASFEGNFVHSVWVYDDEYDYIESSCDVIFTKDDDVNYSISNFLGRTGTIKATLNAETNQLEAEPGQLLFSHSSYGDILVYPFFINDDYELEIDYEGKIFFSSSGDRIMIDNDGIVMIINEGTYAGYIVGSYLLFNQFDRINGTMTCTNAKGEDESYNIAWDGDAINDGYVDVYGFCNISVVTINTDAETGLAYMENGQDVIYYNSQYGMFSTVGLTYEDGSFYLADSTSGSYDMENNIIKLDWYGFANSSYQLYGSPRNNTVITGPAFDPIVGIDAVAIANKQQNEPVYDLMGRPTEAIMKGQLYVKEGRKFILR